MNDIRELTTMAAANAAAIEDARRKKEKEEEKLLSSLKERGGLGGRIKVSLAEAGRSMAENSPYLPAGGLPKSREQQEWDKRTLSLELQKETTARAQNNYYSRLKNAADFGEKSKYRSTATGEAPYLADGTYQGNGFRDIDYDIINRNEKAKRQENAGGARNPLGEFVGGTKERSEMNDEEIAVFNYLYAQDEVKGDKKHTAAYEYIDYLTKDLNARERETKEKEYREFGEEHPGWASAASIALSPMKAIGYAGQAIDYLADGEIDENAGYNQYSHMTNAMRGAVSEKIAASGKWGKVGSFGYNIGMSLGDSLMSGSITGGIRKGASALSRKTALRIMGSGVAADTIIEAKDRGLSDDQAFTLGTIARAAEIVTEKFSLDALLDGKWEKGAVQYILKNSWVEGSEEVGADLINTLADVMVSQDKSQWRQAVDGYMKAGYTESEAFGKAAADKAKDIGLSFAGGALAGGALSSLYGPMVHQRGKSYRNTGDAVRKLGDESIQGLVEEGFAMGQESKAHKTAATLRERLNNQEDIDSYDLGKLLHETVRENTGADGEQYSISRTEDGRAVAVVDDDILSHMDTFSWNSEKATEAKKATKEALLAFQDGVKVNNVEYKVNRISRREYAGSKDTEWLYHKDKNAFADKMRAAANMDDVITAATSWRNDGKLTHPRKDNFVDFAHGDVLIQSGDNRYTARVVVGITKGGNHVLYDVVDMKPTSFIEKEETPPTAAGKNTQSDIQRVSSEESIADNGAGVKLNQQAASFKEKETGAAQTVNPSPGVGRKTAVVSSNSSILEGDQTVKGGTLSQEEWAEKKARAMAAATTELERTAIQYDIVPETFRRVQRIAAATGKDIRFYESKNKGENGYHDKETGVIYINKNAANPIAQIIGHELTHHIEVSGQYISFRDLVLKRIENTGGDIGAIRQQKKDLYARNGVTLKDGLATVDAEIVAEYVEKNLLTDEQSIRNLVRDNRPLGKQIFDWLTNLLAKLGVKGAEERAFLARARDLYRKALAESAIHYAPMAGETEIARDINAITDETMDMVQYSISETLGDDLMKVLENKFAAKNNEVYIGETSNFLTDTIGAKSLRVTMPANKAYSAMVTEKRAIEDGRYQKGTNYHGLGLGGLMRALKGSENPIAAFADTGNEASKRANNIVLVTDQVQDGGDLVAVVQAMNVLGNINGEQIQANKVITAYDRATLTQDIEKAALEGRLLYLDKKRSQTALAGLTAGNPQRIGLANQNPANWGVAVQDVDFKKNIQDFWDNVKWAESGKDSYSTGGSPDEKGAFARAYEAAERKKNEQYSFSDMKDKYNLAKLKNKTTTGFLSEVIGLKKAETQDTAAPKREAEAITTAKRDLEEYWDSLEQMADVMGERTNPEEKVSVGSGKNKQSLKEKTAEGWSFFLRKMVDSGEAVSRIGKAVGDKNLYHYYNMARASSNAAISMITDNRTDIYGRTTGKGLNEIMEGIRRKGDDYYKKFQLYLFHMHNADRMSRFNPKAVDDAQAAVEYFRMTNPEMMKYTDDQMARMAADESNPYCIEAREYMELKNALGKAENTINKPVFGFDVTAADSEAIANRLLRENPEFTAEAQEVYDYLDNLMRYRLDSGLITEADYQKLKMVYPHYVPTFRIFEREKNSPWQKGKVQIGSTVKRATGGTEKLMPLHKAIAQQTMSVVREGSKNRFGQRLLNAKADKKAMDLVYEIREYHGDFHEDTFDQPEDAAFRAKNTFVVRQNGKLWEMEVSPALFEAVEALSPSTPENNIALNVIRKANNLFKALITEYNPTFTVRNIARDFQDAELYSKNARAFTGQLGAAVNEIRKNGKYWRQYKALGGTYSSIFDYETGEVEKGGWIKRNIFGKIGAINMGAEQAPRLAEFMATVKAAEKKGAVSMDTLMEAMYNAADITTNFGRSGTLGKVLNANFVPFLNPGIQGFSKMVRTLTETKGFKEWLGLVGKAAAVGIAPTLINALLYGDDDEWDALKQRDKDTCYLIKTGEHTWFKLPKGRAVSLLGMGTSMAMDAAEGKDIDWGEFISTAASQTAPSNPLKTNILQAWLDADLFDKDSPGKTWYGSDIENQRLRNYAPGERYDASTDAISKWLGKTFNLSPKKINYLLNQYTGVVGDIVLPLTSQRAERDMFTAAFTVDTTYSNRYSNDFYEKKNELTYAKNSVRATGVDEILYKHWNRQGTAVSEINAAIREIEADTTLSNKEKRELGAAQHAIRNGIMKQALETYDQYAAAVERYYSQSKLEEESDRIDEAYRKANREVFGAEYALRTYNKSVYATAEKLHEERGLSYEKFADAYFAYRDSGDRIRGYRAVIDAGLNDREQMAVFSEIMPEGEYKKLQTGFTLGISPKAYIRYREALNLHDIDGNGSFNQREVVMALNSIGNMDPEEALLLSLMGETVDNTPLSNWEKAALWQLTNKSWKPQNNPYSQSIGQQVYEAMRGGKPGVLGELRLPM